MIIEDFDIDGQYTPPYNPEKAKYGHDIRGIISYCKKHNIELGNVPTEVVEHFTTKLEGFID